MNPAARELQNRFNADARAVRRRIEMGRPKPVALSAPARLTDDLSKQPIERWPAPPPQHDAHCGEYRAYHRALRGPTIQQIVLATARHFGLNPDVLIGPRRTDPIVRPRQIAFWIARRVTDKSTLEIARRMGGKDHTTVLSGARKIEQLRAESPDIAEAIETILATLQVRL